MIHEFTLGFFQPDESLAGGGTMWGGEETAGVEDFEAVIIIGGDLSTGRISDGFGTKELMETGRVEGWTKGGEWESHRVGWAMGWMGMKRMRLDGKG